MGLGKRSRWSSPLSPLVVAVGDERAEEESGDGWMKRMGDDRGLIGEGIGSGDNGEEDVEVKERGKEEQRRVAFPRRHCVELNG